MSATKIHSSSVLELFSLSVETELELPVVNEAISAGFPSPAMDFIDKSIDLNKHLIKHPATTFLGRVKGHSMNGAGIFDGNLLIIDKNVTAKNDQIAICYIDGDFTIKRIRIEADGVLLIPENLDYLPIKVTAENNFLIWGIVTHVIRAL